MHPSGYSLGHNHRRILEALRLNGPLPRIDVAEITDLQPATLTRLGQDLIDWGFLEDVSYDDVAESRASAKRKTRLLRLDDTRLHTVGIAVTFDRIACSIGSLSGQVLAETTLIADMHDPVDVAEKAAAAVAGLVADTRLSVGDIIAAGLSLPINFRDDASQTHIPDEWPRWRGSEPKDIFSTRLVMPVWVANDGHAAALAEAYFGAGIGMDSFTLIYFGYGIGGGNIVNRRLFKGTFGNAAAFGDLFPQRLPRPSGRDLLNTLADLGLRYRSLFDLPAEIAVDPRLRPWIERVADQVLPIVGHAQSLFDSEGVILGGLLPPALTQAIADRLRQLHPADRTPLRLAVSPIAPAQFHLGPACLPQYEITAPHRYSGRAVKGYL